MSQQRNGSGNSLDRAKAALAETQARLAALATKRNAELLRGTDASVALVDGEIEVVQRLLRTHTDRVKLLEVEAEQAAVAKRAKEKSDLIGRIETKLAERDKIAAELAKCVKAADEAFVKLLAVNRTILAAWPWSGGDVGAAMLGDAATLAVLRNEIFRVAGRVPPGGGMPPDPRGPSYPGAQCEQLEFIMLPERTKPMTEKFAEATAAATAIMRGGRTTAAVPELDANGLPKVERTPKQIELSRLLQRQLELAELDGEEADREYGEIGRQIAELGVV
jgi:hypothetical protein